MEEEEEEEEEEEKEEGTVERSSSRCSARWMSAVDRVKNPRGSRDLDRTIGRWRSVGERSRGREESRLGRPLGPQRF